MRPEKIPVARFVERPGGQRQDGLSRFRFGCGEASTVEFEEQDADDKTGALVTIDERMIAHDACRIRRRQVEEAGRIGIGVKLLRASEHGIQQGGIPNPRCAAVQG